MATLASLVVGVTADTRGVQTGLRGATRSFTSFAASAAKVGAVLAAAFAARKISQGLKGTLSAFREQEDAVASLRAALIATGKAGDSSLRQLMRSASEFQEITTAGDEAIIKATASLAQLAPALDTAALEQAQKAIVGIAGTFTKGDLDAAAQIIGKSVGGTTNALARYGIELDTAATAQEKMAAIVDQSNTFFAVAEAAAQTTGGKYDQLQNTVGDLKEQFGFIITKIFGTGTALTTMKGKVEAGITILTENQNTIIAWGKVLIAAGVVAVQFGLGVVRAMFNMATAVARILGGLGKLILATFTLNGPAALQALREMRDGVLKDLGDMVAGFEGLVDSFGDLKTSFLNAVNGIVEGSGNMASGVNDNMDTAGEGLDDFAKQVSDLQHGVQSAFTSLVADVSSAFRGMADDNLTTLERMADAVQQFAASVERTMLELAAKNLGEKIFGSLSGGGKSSTLGSIATIAGSILASVFRSGGVVGSGGQSRMVPALAFAGAPRFAGGGIAGLASNEVPAILHKGETVIPAGKGVGGSTTIVNQTINLNFSSVDARGMDALLRSHAGTIAEVVGEAAQDGRGFRQMMRGR